MKANDGKRLEWLLWTGSRLLFRRTEGTLEVKMFSCSFTLCGSEERCSRPKVSISGPGVRAVPQTQLYLHSFVCDRFPYMKFEFLILYDLSCGQVDVSVQKVFGGHFPKLASIYR